MSERSKFFQSGARALTGLVITAAAGAGVLLITTIDMPTVERAPHALTVDTHQSGARDLVCAGSFAELGADPARPDIAVPVGDPSVVFVGDGELTTLEVSAVDETSVAGARVFSAPMTSAIGAAQAQQVSTSTVSGQVASNCVEPVNEQWMVGGKTTLGESMTLSLGNTSEVPATVQIAVYDENGEVAAFQTAGVIVAPNSQQIVSLNGYAPEREALAVRITSTGAPVGASLGSSRVEAITPVGASTISRQLRPATRLVIPGLANVDVNERGDRPTHSETPEDRYPVRVQAIAPDGAAGTATVSAIDDDGTRTPLGEIELGSSAVGVLDVTAWPEGATAIVVEADVPVYASALGNASSEGAVDYDWFTPAPEIDADRAIATPIAGGGDVFAVNLGSSDATLRFGEADADADADSDSDDARTVTVPAGASVRLTGLPGKLLLTSDQPIHLGVRALGEGRLAGYPIEPLAEPGGEFTVFTR